MSGWKVSTAVTAVDAMKALEPYCGSFVYTHIDNEGMMMGFPPDVARELRVSKEILEDGLGEAVDTLAYPFGKPGRQFDELLQPEAMTRPSG